MPINDGSIILGIKLGDTSDIERKISELQRKLRSLREGGALGQLAQQYRSRGMEDRANQLDQFRQREQVRNRRELEQSFRNQEKSLDSLKRHYDNIQKGLDSMVKGTDAWKQKSTEAAEVWDKIVGKAAQVKATYQELFQGNGAGLPGLPMQFQQGFGPFSARDLTHIARSKQMGGFGGAMKGVGRVMTPAMMAQLGAGALGAMDLYGQAQLQLATYPERLTQREATTAGMLGELGRLQMNRRSYEFDLYGPERLKALETAQTRVGAEKVADRTGLAGSTAAMIGGGLLVAGGLAAAPFTSGASLGATLKGGAMIAGGAGLAYGGAKSFLGSDRQRSMVTDAVGLTEGAYDREMQSVFAKTYQSDLAAQKAKNIDLTLSQEFFEKNSNRFRGLQRQFGLSDQELYAGPESIFQRAGRAGYDMDVMTQNMQGIMGAGGTTAVGRAGALTAGKFARNLDVTNAAQIMGKLSGGYGMDEIRSKDEMIRMYAEATRIGLDSSEIRDYMQTAADVGFRTGGDQDVIQQLLSAGVGDLQTSRGIQASQNAFQRIRQKTGTREGLTGQFKMAQLSELGFNMDEIAYISDLSIDQISEDDPILKQMLKGKDVDIKDLRKRMMGSTFRQKRRAEASEEFVKSEDALRKAEIDLDKLDEVTDPDKKKLVEDYREKQAKLGGIISVEESLPENKQERMAYIRSSARAYEKGEGFEVSKKKAEEEARKGLDEESVKAVDKQLRAFAKMDLGNLKLLSDAAKDGTTNLEKLTKSFDAVDENTSAFAAKMGALAKQLENITSEDIKNDIVKILKERMENNQSVFAGNESQDNKSVQEQAEKNMGQGN